jgi:hypothetical protein
METENKEKMEFKNMGINVIPERLKEKINTHLEKLGKPKKFDIPAKNNEE